jgi:hypothetical protein
MRAVGAFFLAISLSLLIARPALAEKRVALVIGNSGYQHVARLDNPANDASAMTEVLKGAGFDLVETFHDLKTSEMRRVLRDFSDHARDADVAVVYYAGHGIEVDGTNYLIPVDAALERDIDVYDEALALDRILVTIEPAKQLRLVILDACRDNPFAKTMKRTNGARAVGRGPAKVEPNSPNTLIAFASKAGSTALDGDSKHSPFTAALVKYIGTPGLDLRKAFGFVRDDVLKNTGNRQEPYVYGSLGGDDLPLVPAKSAAVAPPADPNAEVRRDYELALQIGTREVWTAFLAQYPEGLYASLAKGQLDKIASEKQSGQAKVATAEQGSAVPDKDVAGKISSDAARPEPAGGVATRNRRSCCKGQPVRGRDRAIHADGTATGRLPHGSGRWRMDFIVAPRAGTVQSPGRNEIRRQGRKRRCPRRRQGHAGADLSADLPAWFQARRRGMHQDRMPTGL